jgi:hypothetical protein
MARLEVLEGLNMTNWLQLTLKASVSDSPEMKAVLAAQNRIVELERKLAASDAPQIRMPWEGGEAHWRAEAGDLVAVVVTLDDEAVPENYMCWIARKDDEDRPAMLLFGGHPRPRGERVALVRCRGAV